MAGRAGMRLGIDFGTSHTVAALAEPDGQGRPMQFESSFLMPSAVHADTDGRLLVGRDAERSARLDPARFEPNPKRRIDDGAILLGHREYPVPDVIAAVLRRVVDEASRVVGVMPADTVLTYPANWAGSRKGILAEAAARAGVPAVTLVPEPVAAARYFTAELGHTMPPGGVLVVYDFGGGTFDTSVLRYAGDQWEILATDGLADLGGVDLDSAIVEHLSQTVGTTDPARWLRLVHPDDDLARRRHLMLWADARAAKEQLSRSSSAAIHVPLFDVDTHLTRDEFERIARPYLTRTVDLTIATLQRAGIRPDEVRGLLPVGGSSRIPLAGTLLHQRIGIAPTLIEDPELVVALGSLRAFRPTVSGSEVASPLAAASTSPAPMAFAPPSAPAPGSPPAASPVPPAEVPASQVPPAFAGPASTSPAPAADPPPVYWRSTRAALAAAVAVLVALAVSFGPALWRAIGDTPDNSGGNRTPDTTRGGNAAPPGGRVQRATVNKTAWYAGLKLTFGEARYNADQDPPLVVDVRFENLTGEPYWMGYLTTAFQSGTVFFPGEVEIGADVPAEAKTDGRMVFNVKQLTAPINAGSFVIGGGNRAQSVVPVGNGQLVANEPSTVVKDRQVVNRDLVVTFTTCELRADLVKQQRQADKDNRVFSCFMDARYTGSGSRYFGGQAMFRLRLPDGTTVGPTVDDLRVLVGAIESKVYVAFTFKWPLPGRYTFQMINKASSSDEPGPANTTEISFTVDASASVSTG